MLIGTRPLVIIESPYGNPTRLLQVRNKHYLYAALRDSWDRGEMPLASHQIFPAFLNENNKAERAAGISAGYDWWPHCEYLAIYSDLGISTGMERAIARADSLSIPYRYRNLEDWKTH